MIGDNAMMEVRIVITVILISQEIRSKGENWSSVTRMSMS
jgi:hypothetical protein